MPRGAGDRRAVGNGVVVVHEVGHYLGLQHTTSDSDNFMYGPKIFHPRCDPSETQTDVTADQAATMKEHCMVHNTV